MISITDDSFKAILAENKLVLVQFSAAWCSPCRMLSPVIEKLAGANPDIAIGKLDIDGNKLTASEFGIMSIPTLLFFKDGALVNILKGVTTYARLQSELDKLKSE